MKKSVEILGLPVISITEGRELGMSKTLLIDSRNGVVAAITIEDEDWYRGVKLIPYESVIAIGDDAVTVTNSENILKLEEASDYENLLDENIRVIGTKAITKSGTIQGNITEVFVGDNGSIEKCEVTAPDGTTTEVTADQISIFGKQVTVIDPDGQKKNELSYRSVPRPAAPSPIPVMNEPVPEPPVAEPVKEEVPAVSDAIIEPELAAEEPVKEEKEPEIVAPAVEETVAPSEPVVPAAPEKEEEEIDFPVAVATENAKTDVPEPEAPKAAEVNEPVEAAEPVPEPEPAVETVEEPKAESVPEVVPEPAETEAEPVKEEPVKEPEPEPVVEKAEKKEEPPKPKFAKPIPAKPVAAKPAPAKPIPAKPIPAKPVAAKPAETAKQASDRATEERHRRFLLGKKAARTIKTDAGYVIVEAGADITEEVLQKAKLANKFIELSMNVQ